MLLEKQCHVEVTVLPHFYNVESLTPLCAGRLICSAGALGRPGMCLGVWAKLFRLVGGAAVVH